MTMDNKKNIVYTLFQYITSIFGTSLIVMSITGWALINSSHELAEPLIFGSEGLSYQSIFQIFTWSCILATLITILTGDIFFKKIMYLWRSVVLFLLGATTTIIYAIVFRWFPLDDWMAWTGFLVFFTAGFCISLTIMLVLTKRSDKRYEKLLSEYKAKRRNQND
jgi:hypothetical protein